MIKTKLARYDILSIIVMFVSVAISMVLSIFVASGVFWCLWRFVASEADKRSLVFLVLTVWFSSSVFIGIGISRLVTMVFRPLLHCDIEECNKRAYPEGFYVLRHNSQDRAINLSNLKTGGYIECIRDTYSVCVGFSYEDIEAMIYRMDNRLHSVHWEIPRSYIMPDGVTCLQGAKISLAAALKARKALREDETVFFIYHVDYPNHKGQLAHADRDGEIVVIDVETVNHTNYTAPA